MFTREQDNFLLKTHGDESDATSSLDVSVYLALSGSYGSFFASLTAHLKSELSL